MLRHPLIALIALFAHIFRTTESPIAGPAPFPDLVRLVRLVRTFLQRDRHGHRLFMIEKAQKHQILSNFTKTEPSTTHTRGYANSRPMKLWSPGGAAQVGVVAGWERLKSCPDQNQVATQTFLVPCMNRRLTTKFVLLLAMLLLPFVVQAETSPQAALSSALRATPAVGVVVDLKTGRLLATVKDANQSAAPGSILKPLFLAAALEQHEVLPQTTVFCRRNLRIVDGVHEYKLPCTHPQSDVAFAAQEALAYSCNQYFAALADRIPTPQLAAILQHYGLPQTPTPLTREQKQLLVLGIEGIAVSPAQMAAAYRKLFLELDKVQGDAVGQGLKDSVPLRYGPQRCRTRRGNRGENRNHYQRWMVCRQRSPRPATRRSW